MCWIRYLYPAESGAPRGAHRRRNQPSSGHRLATFGGLGRGLALSSPSSPVFVPARARPGASASAQRAGARMRFWQGPAPLADRFGRSRHGCTDGRARPRLCVQTTVPGRPPTNFSARISGLKTGKNPDEFGYARCDQHHARSFAFGLRNVPADRFAASLASDPRTRPGPWSGCGGVLLSSPKVAFPGMAGGRRRRVTTRSGKPGGRRDLRQHLPCEPDPRPPRQTRDLTRSP